MVMKRQGKRVVRAEVIPFFWMFADDPASSSDQDPARAITQDSGGSDQDTTQTSTTPSQPNPEIEALKATISELKKVVENVVDAKLVKSLMDQIQTMQSKLEKLEQLEEERRQAEERKMLESLSEVERLKYELQKKDSEIERVKKELEEAFGKKARELEATLKQYEEEKQRLAQSTIRARALEVATRLGAYNPEQVFALVKENLIVGNDGEVYARVMDSAGNYIQQPVDDFLKEFLSRPENKNLVRTKAAVGDNKSIQREGTKPSAAPDPLKAEFERFVKNLDPAKRALIEDEAMVSGRPVEDMLYVEFVKHRKAQEYKKRYQRR